MSIYFYVLIDIRFVFLLGGATVLTYLLGLIIEKRQTILSKYAYVTGIVLNLGMLFAFKYYDFFRVTAESFFASIGLGSSLPYWEIIFPVGISFYSFRMISYLIDLWRKKYKAETSIIDFSLYAFFFPCLLAGPITRANEFIIQLKNNGARTINGLENATTLFFIGLFKKVVLSSWLSANIVDNVFAVPEQFSSLAILLAVIGYTLVIYCDFSGYSDMAIACAKFLGFEISPNFLFPYGARSITEFWRRWHISFYLWMRDYLYIPLGGNRKGVFRSYINGLIVFAVSGLWHGAAGHYLVWGLWHGIGLMIHRLWDKISFVKFKVDNFFIVFLEWIVTFSFVSFGWIFFRAENMERAMVIIKGLWHSDKVTVLSIWVIAITTLIMVFVLLEQKIIERVDKFQLSMSVFAWIMFWFIVGLLIYGFAPNTVPPFIYFSF
ncbi:MAG: MBOAT family O-acyltransferase [Candidatus Paceibacterota bacterium]